MPRKRRGKRRATARRAAPRRRAAVRRRTITRDRSVTRLLERGGAPAAEEAVAAPGESPSEITSRGGPGPDMASAFGGPRAGPAGPPGGRSGGAAGHEGLGFPGEDTWGEERNAMERKEEQGGGARAAGRPPVSRQSDEELARTIHEILEKDPELDATDIEVAVEGGAVTLTGTVGSRDAKLLAEELVESTPGVREVHNRLRVAR